MLFATVFTMYPRAAVSARRIQEALDATSEIKEPEQPVTETKTKGFLNSKMLPLLIQDMLKVQ